MKEILSSFAQIALFCKIYSSIVVSKVLCYNLNCLLFVFVVPVIVYERFMVWENVRNSDRNSTLQDKWVSLGQKIYHSAGKGRYFIKIKQNKMKIIDLP